MLMCDAHWTQMQEKAKELGMGHLCSHSAREAADYFKSLLAINEPQEIPDMEWDPLMAMNFNFMKRMLLTIGWVNDCPLCIVRGDFDRHNTDTGRCGDPNCTIQLVQNEHPWDMRWIKDCANAMKDHAESHGMLSFS